MEIAVVYESMYGVTHEVADAIAAGVKEARPEASVLCVRVDDADPARIAAADLLVVGGPTHMRGMSSGMSRKMAVTIAEKQEAEKGTPMGHGLEPDVESESLRDWFHQVPKAARGHRAAAFDTRGEGGPIVGGAAKGIAHRLEKHGYDLIAGPEGFIVEGDQGLLRPSETERARQWGASLVREPAGAGAAG